MCYFRLRFIYSFIYSFFIHLPFLTLGASWSWTGFAFRQDHLNIFLTLNTTVASGEWFSAIKVLMLYISSGLKRNRIVCVYQLLCYHQWKVCHFCILETINNIEPCGTSEICIKYVKRYDLKVSTAVSEWNDET
jgi:hypothetical protein